jgi:Periplasmic copper-binding protein (NosD)
MKSSSLLLLVSTGLILAAPTSSAQTAAVGNCRPHLVSYPTISAAVAAVAANSTVLVCPGTYPEQVTIAQGLTLKGLKAGTGAYPVITVPSGGLVGSFPAQLSAQQPEPLGAFGPVNISNLVVDGAGSGVDCSTGGLLFGIEYVFASGSLDNVEVRNQNPGGCGYGISVNGDAFTPNTVNLRNSRIHNFDNTGFLAGSNGGTGFLVNLASNWIAATSPSVQAGVYYGFAQGLVTRNIIEVGGQTGLVLDAFFGGVTASENTVSGSTVGIFTYCCGATVTHNGLFNNGTGISLYNSSAGSVINSNLIVHSAAAAIDVACAEGDTVEKNAIFNAPIGIANISSGDTVTGNVFHSVPTKTTTCP